MDSFRSTLARVVDAVRERPLLAILATNALTSAAFVYVLSEGKPGKFIYKLLFNAVLAAVPSSLKERELGEIRSSIERDVVGTSLDGDDVQLQLPPQGESRSPSPVALSTLK